MYPTLHLILAHFLADFPFQPRVLVAYKQKKFLGVIIHSFTHLITSAVLLFPFIRLKRVGVAILVIFLVHNVVDYAKIKAGQKHPKWNKFALYIIDQIAHLTAIVLVGKYYLGELPLDTDLSFYSDSSVVSFVLVLTLSTYFYDVTRWTYLNNKKPLPYVRDYGMMVRNGLIVTIAFGLYWLTR